jgi:hypothetical protein
MVGDRVIGRFYHVAALTVYLVYTGVSNFVAAWNITDLPGIVVSEAPLSASSESGHHSNPPRR